MKREKTIIGLVFVLVLSFSGLLSAQAQESNLRTRTQEMVESVSAARLSRLQSSTARLLAHFRSVTMRLDSIMARLNNHLAKLETEGKNVVAAKILLQETEALVTKAKAVIQGLEGKVAGATTATGFKAMREELNQARGAVGLAQQKLLEAIKSLRVL